MKKLKITKEVIMSLSSDDLGSIKGGAGSDRLCSDQVCHISVDKCPPKTAYCPKDFEEPDDRFNP